VNDRRFYVLVGSITLALAILGAILGTWWDEEYTLATTSHGPIYAFGRALTFELQAPLYFVVLAVWRGIDSSVFFARLFSVLCIAGFAFAAREIARRIRPDLSPLPFVVLAIANPFVVFAAMEIRLYALALLLSSLLWLAFCDGYLSEDRPRARVWFVAIAIASIYVQYFLAFALVAGACALIVARRYAALRSFLLACCVAGIAIAPVLWWAPAQAAANYLAAASVGDLFRSMVQPAMTFALPLSYDWTGAWYLLKSAHHVTEIGTLILLLVFAAKRLSAREWAIVAFPILMWCVFFFAAATLHLHYTLPRHFVGLYVPEIAALYVLVSRAAVDGQRRLALGIALLYALFSAATLITTYRSLAKPGDWPRVGAYLTSHVQAGDRVAVFPARGLPALVRWYHGPDEVQPLPHAENLLHYDEQSDEFTSTRDARVALEKLTRGHKLWLVIAVDCDDAGARAGCKHLVEAVSRNYPRLRVNMFYLNRVVELSAPPQRAPRPRP
jgi:hypothetical protein